MKVIHLSRGNPCLRLEMLILAFTETHIVVLSHNIFNMTGGTEIALVALVGQTASLVRVLPPPSPISSRFYSPAPPRVSGLFELVQRLLSGSHAATSEAAGWMNPFPPESCPPPPNVSRLGAFNRSRAGSNLGSDLCLFTDAAQHLCWSSSAAHLHLKARRQLFLPFLLPQCVFAGPRGA